MPGEVGACGGTGAGGELCTRQRAKRIDDRRRGGCRAFAREACGAQARDGDLRPDGGEGARGQDEQGDEHFDQGEAVARHAAGGE